MGVGKISLQGYPEAEAMQRRSSRDGEYLSCSMAIMVWQVVPDLFSQLLLGDFAMLKTVSGGCCCSGDVGRVRTPFDRALISKYPRDLALWSNDQQGKHRQIFAAPKTKASMATEPKRVERISYSCAFQINQFVAHL